jgi:hypothetical protein
VSQVIKSSNGQCVGQVFLQAEGTSGPFIVQLQSDYQVKEYFNIDGEFRLTNLCPGIHIIKVIDAYGCEKILTVDLGICDTPFNIQFTPQLSCIGGTSGVLSVAVTGGQTPYQYEWEDGTTSSNLSGIGAGEYCVTITDATNCATSACYTLEEENAITISPQLTPACFGQQNGAVTLSVSGGIQPYTYEWDNGLVTSENILSNVGAGVYTVTVTDVQGCIASETITLEEYGELSIALQSSSTCPGPGGVTLTPSGGLMPYQYGWSTGASTQNLTNLLEPGEYCVTVTDQCGQEEINCVTVGPVLPYIERVNLVVTLQDGTEVSIYDAQWTLSANECLFFEPNTIDIPQAVVDAMDAGSTILQAYIYTSKPLTGLAFVFEQLGIGGISSSPSGNAPWLVTFNEGEFTRFFR